MAEMTDQGFVEMVVKAIVDSPEKVSTVRSVDEMGVLIELTVDAADMGKIIGKEGRTAKSIRTLLRVFGAKNDARINLKIVEPEGSIRPERKEEAKEEIAEEKVEVAEEKPEVSEDEDVPTDVLA
ncbi:MAG: KH domain-containing protein [Candidatus Berkelbacteria bacterium]|nr:KH domain-containing protein [Candidatus Berkelbacteria bacterium]